MTYLGLYVLCVILFNQVLRWAQKRGADAVAAGAVNYLVATAVSGVRFWVARDLGEASVPLGAVGLGLLNGLAFYAAFLALLSSYKSAGVGITVAFVGSAAIVPSVASWIIWGEEMTSLRWVALAILPAAMALMRPARPEPEGAGAVQPSRGSRLAPFLVLATSGAITTMHKGATLHFGGSGIPVYQLALFASAALCTSCHALARGGNWAVVELAFGAAIGTANGLALVFQLASLAVLQAVIFFPTAGSLLIALNLAVSWIVWRERLRPRQFAGVVLAAAVVILTNMPGQHT